MSREGMPTAPSSDFPIMIKDGEAKSLLIVVDSYDANKGIERVPASRTFPARPVSDVVSKS